jgi:uncharacterized protein YqfA (UPF0365 family)
MTKREKAVVFMICATLLNILATALLFIALIALYSLTLGRWLKVGSAGLAVGISFILSVVLSAVIYKKVLEKLRKKINFEERFGRKA